MKSSRKEIGSMNGQSDFIKLLRHGFLLKKTAKLQKGAGRYYKFCNSSISKNQTSNIQYYSMQGILQYGIAIPLFLRFETLKPARRPYFRYLRPTRDLFRVR